MSQLTQRLGLTRYEADEYYAQSLEAHEKGKLGDAIDRISDAILLLPLNSEYHAARGLFFLEDGADEQAAENFRAALKLHSGEMLANYGLGVLAFRSGEWEAAVSWFNKARAVSPTRPEIPYFIALIYHRQQDNRTAKDYMLQAKQLMEDADDKRRLDAKRWIQEFERLIRQERQRHDERTPVQKQLPIDASTSGLRISREENSGAALNAGGEDETEG